MPRISISISDEEAQWLKDHPAISPSGLFKEALNRFQGYSIKQIMREEIARRIQRLNLEFRIKVIINDSFKSFNFGPSYPQDDITELIAFISGIYKECKEMKENTKTVYFHLKNWQGIGYATVMVIKEFDGENQPIVEFESQLKVNVREHIQCV